MPSYQVSRLWTGRLSRCAPHDPQGAQGCFPPTVAHFGSPLPWPGGGPLAAGGGPGGGPGGGGPAGRGGGRGGGPPSGGWFRPAGAGGGRGGGGGGPGGAPTGG